MLESRAYLSSCCQGVAKSLHKDCVARMEPSKAGFVFLSSDVINDQFLDSVFTLLLNHDL